MTRRDRRIVVIALLVGLVVVALLLVGVVVRHDRAFICANTGSRRGYTEWFFGTQRGHWYEKSRIEEFMELHEPDKLAHRWTSYKGTGKDIFGRSVSFGHGRPGPIIYLPLDDLNQYVDQVGDEKIRDLYEVFSSGDEDRIEAAVAEIESHLLRRRAEPKPVRE